MLWRVRNQTGLFSARRHKQTLGILHQIRPAEHFRGFKKEKKGPGCPRWSPGSWVSTEVDQFDSSVGRQEDVVALDVAVDDPVVVQMLETL